MSGRRVRAIFRKEFSEYRRNFNIVVTMTLFPVLFVIFPLIELLALPASSSSSLLQGDPLAILLGIPALVPGAIAAYAVVGERQQGTLEPVLTTPIADGEFLLGKALAAAVPSVAIAYGVCALFLACVEVFAHPTVAADILHGPTLLAQFLLIPLIAIWSIWVGIAFSTRSSDFRVAQQLGIFASFPPVVVAYLTAFNVIHWTLGLVVVLGIALLVADGAGWTIVSAMFNRERLIVGSR